MRAETGADFAFINLGESVPHPAGAITYRTVLSDALDIWSSASLKRIPERKLNPREGSRA